MALLADRYELAEPLGSGGMAEVVAAIDLRLDRRVAVKLIRDHLASDDNARARLLHEARAAAAFHHPCAVAVFDVGAHDGRPFVVMELVEGETLADRLAREGTLSPADTVTVGSRVLDALAAAHRRGLVHRDVKPGNVLLPREGGVKLTDFGIAKGLATPASALTATGQIVGTPTYLSPEQASGHGATSKSDLYSVGVVLYECLAGAPPFSGDGAVAIALAHEHEPLPPLSERAPGTPARLAAVVERALAKRPLERHADAQSMQAALDTAGDDVGSAPTISAPAASVALADGGDGHVEAPSVRATTRRRVGLALLAAAIVAVLALIAALAMGEGGLAGTDSRAETMVDVEVWMVDDARADFTAPRRRVGSGSGPRDD